MKWSPAACSSKIANCNQDYLSFKHATPEVSQSVATNENNVLYLVVKPLIYHGFRSWTLTYMYMQLNRVVKICGIFLSSVSEQCATCRLHFYWTHIWHTLLCWIPYLFLYQTALHQSWLDRRKNFPMLVKQFRMITSSNGNIFHVTGLLCGELTGHRWIPRSKASDAELWSFLWSAHE